MVSLEVDAVITVGQLDQDDLIHGRVKTFERNCCPLPHFIVCIFFIPSGEVPKFNVTILKGY